jgi:hypothetical protein
MRAAGGWEGIAVSARTPVKTQKTGKRGGRRSTSWKPGQSGNPKGAPKRGESWAELFKELGNLTPAAAARKCHAIAGQLQGLGDKITLKEAVVLRVFSALLFEPSSGLLNAVLDRVEGKVAQPIDVNWREEVRRLGVSPSEIFEEMVQAAMKKLPDEVE